MAEAPAYVEIVKHVIAPGHLAPYEWEFRQAAIRTRKIDGLLQRWFIVSADDDEQAYVITIWQSQRAAEAYHSSPNYQRRLHAMERHVVGEYQIMGGEVHFHYDTLSRVAQWKSRW
jgi:quinol monooxygenase YgiN